VTHQTQRFSSLIDSFTHRASSVNRLFLYGAIATTTCLLTFLADAVHAPAHALQDSPKAVLDEAWQIVNEQYVDAEFNHVDWQAIRQDLLSRDYSSSDEAYSALREALALLEDPYTRFMTPSQFESLTNQTSGELSGIGIQLQQEEGTGHLVVVQPIRNSPAEAAGIQPGDRILSINGQSTDGMSVETASALIRGEVGTAVVLEISRSGRSDFDVSLTRARIELPAVNYALREEDDSRIGYIRLSEFSAHAGEQMRDAILELNRQNVDAFVLDLRGNPGGLLQASIDISRMWLDGGTIVRTVDRNGSDEVIMANHTALSDRPLAVLVDGNSASSSEILTGALQDNQRAVVIGTQTFGKALVQSVHSLADGSGLAVTVAHYYTPNGTDISHLGIAPDIEVDLTEQQVRTLSTNPSLVGTTFDPQYVQAINALEPSILAQREITTSTQIGATTPTSISQ
jgi:carboxyl-terminal processing protease